MLTAFSTLFGALILAAAPQVKGDYVEARTADVYTGPCFSNAEVFITGDHAVMAWKITEGRYEGEDLSGLVVAAAVKGTNTFSKDVPTGARSVLIVDRSATPGQQKALIALAKALGGERLSKVEDVRTARINLTVEDMEGHDDQRSVASPHHGMPKAPRASVWVPGLAEILTRPLDEDDHACGNEVVEYAPLSKGVTALPAYTLSHNFKGKQLGTTWNDPNCRSSFVGHFAY
ncbi:MAG: hypothetical protein JWN86_2125 [Planctomycetota bacterium]|nr:hypothetical protein [Planctomycetota bacterium]